MNLNNYITRTISFINVTCEAYSPVSKAVTEYTVTIPAKKYTNAGFERTVQKQLPEGNKLVAITKQEQKSQLLGMLISDFIQAAKPLDIDKADSDTNN